MKLHTQTLGSGPPLVLLHGLLGDGGNLRQLAQRLAPDWQVWLPDLRNHGQSPHARPMDWASLAMDVQQTLAAAGINRFVLGGHSLGGKVAMQLAATAPDAVHALIWLDIAPMVYPPWHAAIFDGLADLDRQPPVDREAAMARLAAWVPGVAERRFLLKNLQRGDDGRLHFRCQLSAIMAAYPQLAGVPHWPGAYRGPLLLLYGDRSPYVDAVARQAIAETCPQAQVRAIAGAGHWLNVEQPDAVAAAMQDFLHALP